MNVIFIHSKLDDYGLTDSEFRVYAHLARRAGQNGAAWPSVESIGIVCRLHPKTVRRALKVLVRQRLICRQDRRGDTCSYVLTSPSQWLPLPQHSTSPDLTATPGSDWEGTPTNPSHPYPYQSEPAEGNPIEGNPMKEVYASATQSSEADRIYALYPRKVGRPAAIAAIQKAIASHGFKHVEERTKRFAATYDGAERFIPYPSTWFNQQRYNDEPSTWCISPTSDRERRQPRRPATTPTNHSAVMATLEAMSEDTKRACEYPHTFAEATDP